MAANVEASVIIDRPLGEVFDRLRDMERIPELDPDCQWARRTSEGPIGEGTTFRLHERMPPLGRFRDSCWRYSVFEPNRRIGYDYDGPGGPIAPRGILSFERVGGGTKLVYRGHPHPQGAFRLLSPVIAWWGTRVWNKRMALIKQWLERRPPAEHPL